MKSKTITNMLDNMSEDISGVKRTDAINDKICVFCGSKIDGFRDKLSEREFEISGMCQKCQDEFFG